MSLTYNKIFHNTFYDYSILEQEQQQNTKQKILGLSKVTTAEVSCSHLRERPLSIY